MSHRNLSGVLHCFVPAIYVLRHQIPAVEFCSQEQEACLRCMHKLFPEFRIMRVQFLLQRNTCVQLSGSKWDSTYHSIFRAMLRTEQAEFKLCHKNTSVKQPQVRRVKSGEEPLSSAPLHYATARLYVGMPLPLSLSSPCGAQLIIHRL